MPRSREYQEKYQDLRASYLSKLPKQLDMIDNGWSMLNNINWDHAKLENIQRAVHSIAGTAGSFGLTELSNNAFQLDEILRKFVQQRNIPDNATKIKAYSYIQSMLENAGVTSKLPHVEDLNATNATKVLIVDDDEDQASFVELLCFELGCATKTLKSPSEVALYVKEEVPDVILMDIVFPEGQLAGIDSVKEIYQAIGFKVPIVFISSRNDLSSRVKAYRAGGLGYLHKPIDIAELKVQLELLNNHKNYHAKILIIDDDSDFIDLVKSMLENQGFYSIGSSKPSEVIHLLERHRPDILLLDINMPGIKGDEILSVLRQEIKYAKLPILLITGDTSPATISYCTTHGANGVIPKPLEFNVLLDSIHSVLKSSKALDAVMERVTQKDANSKNVQRHYFFNRVENAIRLSSKNDQQVLASISFKNHENIRRQTGISHIDELTEDITYVIQHDLAENEFITQISELHFALILTNTSQASLDNRLRKLIERISNLQPTQKGHIITLHPCLSLIHLNASYPSVDEAMHVVEAQMLQIIKSKDAIIGIQQEQHLQPLSSEELKLTVAKALEQHSLHLNYQPIFDISGRERLFEGLARMRDANQAIILPDDFIGKIKELGKQNEFNKLIISKCIDDIEQLHGREAQETEIIVKLLLSNKALLPFLTRVSNNLKSSKLRGNNRLIFSITQNDVSTYHPQVLELHEGTKNLECGLMIEQVGRDLNHSEEFLSYIQDIDVRYFRLDPSFTRAIIKKDETALEYLQALSQRKIPIIATHVEDNTMFSKLWETGIRYFQGYFVKRPDESLSFDFNIENTELN